MKRALAGVTGNIKIKPEMDARDVDRALASLKLRMQALSKTLADMRAGVDTKSAEANIVKLQAQLHTLAKSVSSITFGADTTKIDAAIAKEQAKLANLRRQASDLQLDADATKAAQKITDLEAEAFHLNKRLNSLRADVDINKALNRLYAIEAELKVLNDDARGVELIAKTREINAQIEAVRAHIRSLGEEKIDLAANVDLKGLLGAEAAILGLEAAVEKMGGTTKGATAAAAGFKGIWTGGWINGAILGIGIWHIVLDGLLEILIIVTAATAALAAGIAAMSESAKNLATQMKSVQTASSALGVDIKPLTGKFDDLMKSMAPRTIEAFGGGLQLISSQSGHVLSRMEPVVNLFDTWIAKIDIWSAHQRDFGAIINAGRGFLEQLGKAVGILGDSISNLIQKDPGIAHFLLDFIQGALGLLDVFSKLPAPIVTATLAIHGAYIWLKLLVAVPILSFAKSLGILSEAQLAAASSALKFQNIVKFLLFNPFGWATAAAVGLGLVAYQLTQATAYAKKFNAELEQGLSSDTASQAILQISADIGKLNQQIAEVPGRSAESFVKAGDNAMRAGHAFNQVSYDLNKGNIPGALKEVGRSAWYALKSFTGFQNVGPQMLQTRNDVGAFRDEIVKLSDEQNRLFHTTGVLVRGQNDLHIGAVSVSQAFALMDLAGVKASDSFDVQYQKVKNLVTGYETLSIRGGILKNSVNAITFSSLQQQERVQQLNQAWDTFFKTVTGGENGFLTFAKQTIGLFRVLGASGLKMNESNGKISTSLSGLAKSSTDAKISMTGLNDASINARQTFLATADAANTQIDNLTTLANAAGLGQKGTDMLTRATQDMVAALIPAAGHSKALQDVLFALAQHGGYPGANSMKELEKWVGKVQDPMKELDKITETLTTAASNLTDDVKNLSIALGQNLNDAMASAILQATGGQKAFDDFANAMFKTKKNSKQQQDAALALAQQLVHLTGNTKDAHAEFDAFAQQMGVTRKDADHLWQEISGKLTPAINNQANKALPDVKNAFRTWAEVGLDYSRDHADKLWTEITTKLGPKLNGLGDLTAGPVKNKFIDWAMNGLHLSREKAIELWKEVDTLQNHINNLHGKNIAIDMVGNGSYTIRQAALNNPNNRNNGAGGPNAISKGAALGMYVSAGTGPTADDVPAWLSRGEVVVPTRLVNAGAVDHLRGMIPGFSGGGAVKGFANGGALGSTGTGHIGGNLTPKFIDGMFGNFQTTMTDSMVSQMRESLKKAEASAAAAAAAFSAGHVNFRPGAGVGQWAGVARQALSMAGLNPGFVLDVLYQMQTESGGNPLAVNLWDSNARAGHPSVGLMQVIAGTYATYGAPRMGYPGPVAYGVSEQPLANIYAAVNYGKHGKGFGTGPGQIGSGHGYAEGGVVGYAGGGTVSGLRSKLATEQTNERAKYWGLTQSFLRGPKKYLTARVRGELATLASRQKDELAAYAALSGAGLTDSRMHHLAATARAAIRVASDQGLTMGPGSHPLFASDLRKYLGQINVTASGTVPAAPGSPAGSGAGSSGSNGGLPVIHLTPKQIASEGASWLSAWRNRRGGGFGAAWGPVVVNQQIAAMQALEHKNEVLSKATGLTGKQHSHYAALAADEKKRLNTLKTELVVERAWRSLLEANDKTLKGYIAAAGNAPGLKKNVAQWTSQMNRQKNTIAQISKMLGYSDAQLAALEKAGKLGPGGQPLPQITHTYGGDVGNTIGSFLASVIAPLGMAMGGRVKTYDRGGWLAPGLTMAYNGTGRPEPVGGAAVNITFEVDSSGSEFDRFMTAWLSKKVKVKGAGDVQTAFGQPNIKFVRK